LFWGRARRPIQRKRNQKSKKQTKLYSFFIPSHLPNSSLLSQSLPNSTLFPTRQQARNKKTETNQTKTNQRIKKTKKKKGRKKGYTQKTTKKISKHQCILFFTSRRERERNETRPKEQASDIFAQQSDPHFFQKNKHANNKTKTRPVV
jgi:hypothetical protein